MVYGPKAKAHDIKDYALQKLGRKGDGCFVAGTPIHTQDGLKPIENIQPGDLVWSRSEWDEGESAYRSVIESGCLGEKEIWEVEVAASGGRTEIYRATGNHPFWVEDEMNDEHWSAVEDLRAGDLLRLGDGNPAHVISVRMTDDVENVYNFEVEGFHTYYIGELGVWVHNTNCLRTLSVDKHGNLTDGVYKLDADALAPHSTGALGGTSRLGGVMDTGIAKKSQFLNRINEKQLTFDAARIADEKGLWDQYGKAKVVFDDFVGVTGQGGARTNTVNVYRTTPKGNQIPFIHASPGTPRPWP